MPENVPGRTVELGEGGVGVVVASRLLLGETVRVEFLLPHTNAPVRATALVRYQRELCCGLQFVRLPAEHQSTIRYWTRCEAALSFSGKDSLPERPAALLTEGDFSPAAKSGGRKRWIAVMAFTFTVALGLQWWHWQHEWAELEGSIPERQITSTKQLLRIPGDVMQQRLRHRVTPDYPPDARRAGVQGTVLLRAVVSTAGTVTDVQYLSGPDSLSQAAEDAVRWWKYEPYLVNDEPMTVETTVAVNFRLKN
jgi:TonB family protein